MLTGVALVAVGLVVAGLLLTVSDYVAPTKVTLTAEKPYAWHMVPLKQGTTLIVEFQSSKAGGQVDTIVVGESTFKRAEAGENVTDYLAKAQAAQGRLEWICKQDGNYYAVFMTPRKVVSKDFEQTITEQSRHGYTVLELKVGSVVRAEYKCKDPDDQVRAVLINEDWFNMFQQGTSVPKPNLLADATGNNGRLDWNCPIAGKYYLLVVPTAGKWPVPYALKITVTYVLEGSEWPLAFSYTMEGRRSEPWYIGAIVAAAGAAVILLGLRTGAAKAPPSPATATTQPRPTVTEPRPPIPSPPSAFCISCGAQIPADSEFCPKCGGKQE